MRRYGVRILVAVLTFFLGVAFSFGLGLFWTKETRSKERWRFKRDCPKTRAQTAHPFTIYNDETAPLRLTYLGPTLNTTDEREQMLQVLVVNTGDRTVSSFSLSGERFGRHTRFLFVDDSTRTVLMPGQSHMSLLPNNTDARTELWLSSVEFEDNSTWNNPRNLR